MMGKQSGMTFIEVLVALVILATSILGAVAMQTLAKKGSFDAMQRSVASSLAQDILERMRVNESSNNFLNNYNGTFGAGSQAAPANNCTSPANPCSPNDIVSNDLYQWEQKLMGADAKRPTSASTTANVGGLVNARGCISHANSAVTVVVSWEGKTEVADSASNIATGTTEAANLAKACGTAGNKRRQVVIEAVIF